VQSNLEHQQICNDHHELRQFGLREFFYSQIRVHIVPQSRLRRGKEAPSWPWSWSSPSSLLRATAHAAPAVLSLVLLLLLLGVHHDLGRLRTSLALDHHRCGGAPGGPPPHWAAVPSVTTVTATVVSSSRPTTGPSAAAAAASADPEWEWDSDSAAASDAPARPTPTSVTMIDVTSTKGDRARPPSGDTSVHGERDALLPMERPLIFWPIQLELPFTREQALEAVEHSLSVAWEILRRLYHFPLDPP
jgi:hypothetical protein